MNITVIGTGYVGLVTGTCLADSGNDVLCVDIDQAKIDTLLSGGVPLYEPGLSELIARNREESRLDFTTDLKRGVKHGDIVFIAVGTPMSLSGEANLDYVFAAAADIGKFMDRYKVVVDKSTVPVGTADQVRNRVQDELTRRGEAIEFDVVSNPEFLKEGNAIADFMKPDRVVVGGDSKRAIELIRELYEPFLRTFHPLIVMDIRSAEMTKYAANCFLANKISFINEISNLCEASGADIAAVREGIGADRRIGYEFLFPGVGYGGSCFPKDVQALIHTGGSFGLEMSLLKAVNQVNDTQKATLVAKIRRHFKGDTPTGDLTGLTFALWGLAFKPQTDDMRDAPSLVIIEKLLALGARIRVYDPEAMDEAQKILGDTVTYRQNIYDCVDGVDALILVTEWNEFRRPSWPKVKAALKQPVVFDGRNIWDPKRLQAEGFTYFGMGRI